MPLMTFEAKCRTVARSQIRWFNSMKSLRDTSEIAVICALALLGNKLLPQKLLSLLGL